jgi:PPK2 family polyphosphate:nucleotide phosphotransferase
MTNFLKKLAVKPGTTIDLNDIPTDATFGWNREDAEKQTEENLARIAELQEQLFNEQKRSLLICLQAMDTGGKDGAVKHVCGAMNPAATHVKSFKKPTEEELAHDFLWRIKNEIPKTAGQVVIFNRSHYEDVGVVRVHGYVDEKVWRARYDKINEFEEGLGKGSKAIPEGTTVLKFWLHISKDEQWDRLMERMNDPKKQYKVSEADFKERPYWHEYMKAFSEAISKCSTEEAPWIIVPSDHKWMRNLIMSQVIVEHLEGLKMGEPKCEVDIDAMRKKYVGKHGEDITPEFNAAAAPKQGHGPANENEPCQHGCKADKGKPGGHRPG